MPTVSQNADLDFLSTSRILNLPDPTSAQHAATKAYVDAHSGGTFTASRAIVSDSGGSLAVSSTTSAQIAALATLTNGRVPFSSGGALTDSANATLDSSGNLTLAGTQQAAYHATKGLFTGSRQDMHGFVDSGGTYRWAIGLDASNNLYFNDQVNNKDVLTLLVGATYTTVRLPAAGTLSFNGGVTTIGLSSQATLSNTLEVNRGKILANSGSLANVLAFSYYVTGATTAGSYSRMTGTFTGTWTATLPDASIVVAGSASALTSGRVPYVTTGGLLLDSANFTFNGTATLTVGKSGTATGILAIAGATSGAFTLTVPAVAGSQTYTLPAAVGAANSVLTDAAGNGTLSWAVPTGTFTGSIATGQVAFGSAANAIAGSNNLFWDNGTARLGIGTTTPAYSIDANASFRVAGSNGMLVGGTVGTANAVWGFSNASGNLDVFEVGVADYRISIKAGGNVGINVNNAGAQLQVNASSSSTIGQIIKLAASQSADGWQLQDSSANVLTSFSSSGNLDFGSGILARWSSTSVSGGSKDLGLARNAAGVLEINNGTAGTYRDLRLRYLGVGAAPASTYGINLVKSASANNDSGIYAQITSTTGSYSTYGINVANSSTSGGGVSTGNLFGANFNAFVYQTTNLPNIAVALQAGGGPLGASGALAEVNGLRISNTAQNGSIITNLYDLRINNASVTGGSSITSYAGIAIAALTSATNNTHLLLGTTTIPSGTYGAYIVSSAAAAIPLTIKGAASQSGNYLNITSSSGSAGDIVALTSAGLWTKTGLDAVTNALTAIQTIQHNSTGTPAANFGSRLLFNLHSSTTTNQNAGSVDVYWTDATHATRTSVVALCAVNSAAALAEVFKVKGDGTITPLDGSTIVCGTTTGLKIGSSTSNKLAFFNSTPIVQFATTGETAGFTANASTAARVDSTFTGNVGSTAYTISDIVKALKNFGLIAA